MNPLCVVVTATVLSSLTAALRAHASRTSLRMRRLGFALLGLAAILSHPAHADAPYGDDFDAPDTPESAVLIAPGGYAATFKDPADADFYRFTVLDGRPIYVTCKRRIAHLSNNWEPVMSASSWCTATLLDPEGVPQGAHTFWTDGTLTIEMQAARAGDWQLAVAGARELWLSANLYCWLPPCPATDALIDSAVNPPHVPYAFSVNTETADATGETADATGGGSIHWTVLLLALVGLSRARMNATSRRNILRAGSQAGGCN